MAAIGATACPTSRSEREDCSMRFSPACAMIIRQAGAQVIRKLSTKSTARASKPEVRLFISYSHKDEAARDKLDIHLAQLKRDNVSTWFDGDLDAGEALDPNIARELRRAHVFVALFSPDYLASKYC